MLCDNRFIKFHNTLKHFRYTASQKRLLGNYLPPSMRQIKQFLDESHIASIEDLRALFVEKLEEVQKYLKGSETDPLNTFYLDGTHVDENTARNRVVDFLKPKIEPLGGSISIEHHMASSNRCDITCTISINGKPNLLVIEVKGQWHKELYNAANEQLHKRYSSHPNAAEQGVYLVLWFGKDIEISGSRKHSINSSSELKESIIEQLPEELHDKIDIFVLDLSR